LPRHSPQLLPTLPETAEHPTTTAATTRTTTTAEPLFIHPEAFRPNSYFVGREDELKALHEMLMDRKRRSEGTSAVLIQCLPGGGKTHVARQYVFQHKDDYPGGVYWVRAKSRHELEYWFWRIARNEALRGGGSGIGLDRRDVDELRDPKKIVPIVRRWLNAQREWLVVFDGVQFDIPGLHEFIPDARNTSLIYTSTERAVTGDPRFDNPQVMELGLLTAQQAQDLLLLEMERKRPWSADDRAMALELVQLMGRLPLMIHVAAQHLKATREPLARYLKSYRSRPKAGDLPAYKAVREQLENRGENAALNLISLLAFFDQHLPVEMLALGTCPPTPHPFFLFTFLGWSQVLLTQLNRPLRPRQDHPGQDERCYPQEAQPQQHAPGPHCVRTARAVRKRRLLTRQFAQLQAQLRQARRLPRPAPHPQRRAGLLQGLHPREASDRVLARASHCRVVPVLRQGGQAGARGSESRLAGRLPPVLHPRREAATEPGSVREALSQPHTHQAAAATETGKDPGPDRRPVPCYPEEHRRWLFRGASGVGI
jgi:hypothetical protein